MSDLSPQCAAERRSGLTERCSIRPPQLLEQYAAARAMPRGPAICKFDGVVASFFVGYRTDDLLKAGICLRAQRERGAKLRNGASQQVADITRPANK